MNFTNAQGSQARERLFFLVIKQEYRAGRCREGQESLWLDFAYGLYLIINGVAYFLTGSSPNAVFCFNQSH